MFNPKRFKYLEENQIAGAETMNPIIDFLRGIRSTTDVIEISPNGLGGMDIGVNSDALRSLASSSSGGAQGDDHTFKVTVGVTGTQPYIEVSDGWVWLPSGRVHVTAMESTKCEDGYMAYVRLTSPTTGTLVYGDGITHVLQTGGAGYRVTLPICTTEEDDGTWTMTVHHKGDFLLADVPYFWRTGYDKTKTQMMVHYAGTDGYEWVDTGVCQ